MPSKDDFPVFENESEKSILRSFHSPREEHEVLIIIFFACVYECIFLISAFKLFLNKTVVSH